MYRRYAINLAVQMMKNLAYNKVEAVFLTTVNKPVKNKAALPFVFAAGGIYAGNIDEYYDGVGAINSNIYIIDMEKFNQTLKLHPIAEKIE